MHDLLLEIYSEELPPLKILPASIALGGLLRSGLAQKGFSSSSVETFGTPHRLAALLKDVPSKKEDEIVFKKGPAVQQSFINGVPSGAAIGFARANHVAVSELEQKEFDGTLHLCVKLLKNGATLSEALEEIFPNIVKSLPFSKMMRWADHNAEFARPIHSILVKHGTQTLPIQWHHLVASNTTCGHRIHHKERVELSDARAYESLLSELNVIPSFEKRKTTLKKQIQELAKSLNATAIMPSALLEEVTGIVEEPYSLIGSFDEKFLRLPKELLIEVMQSHQRYFAVEKDGVLLNKYIIVSHFQSTDPSEIIRGNTKVITARFNDAAFFYDADLKDSFTEKTQNLKDFMFIKGLGSLYDKSCRIAAIIEPFHIPDSHQAALLCKADQTTKMVFEFPELSGIMGQYYAKAAGLNDSIATAIYEHTLPKFATDVLPQTLLGKYLAIADRIDTLVGLFALGQIPTGTSDPYALRRAALGIIRICIETNFNIDIEPLIDTALVLHHATPQTKVALLEFINDRYRAYFSEKNIGPLWVDSVVTRKVTIPLEISNRLSALQDFSSHPTFQSLIQSNKRVKNLLKDHNNISINTNLFSDAEEKALFTAIEEAQKSIEALLIEKNYKKILLTLAEISPPLTHFFDKVRIMHDDVAIKNNRLALLAQTRTLFLLVADLAVLAADTP